MTYWPWWLCALALSSLSMGHWLWLRRTFAVSGRVTALNDRLRQRLAGESPDEGVLGALNEEELRRLMSAATAAEFGEADAPPVEAAAPLEPALVNSPQSVMHHLVFLAAIVVGGALSTWLRDTPVAPPVEFARLLGATPWVTLVTLAGGGVLVGFGTRMAGGCTTGHGLSGLSRLQPGSLVATAVFFGTGIGVSFILGRLG